MTKSLAYRNRTAVPIRKLKNWALTAVICLAGVFTLAPASAEDAKPAAAAPTAEKLDNASCEGCHDGKKGKLEAQTAGGEKRALNAINPEKYGKGVHSTMQCVDCHTEITDAKAQHQKSATAKKPDCISCHEALWNKAKKDGLTTQKARLGAVVDNIEAYKKSLHARPNKDEPDHANAACNDCHDVHTFDVAPEGTTRRAENRLTIAETCGAKCHEDQLEEYKDSIHGKEVLEKKNIKAAVCSDCHTTHAVANTSADPTKLKITASCGNCHTDRYKSYKSTYHGQVTALGYAETGKCFDCHGSHGIQPKKNPDSKVNEKNLLKTCKQCHAEKKGRADATAGFVSFQPHGTAGDFKTYPQIWLAKNFMIGLLVGTFAFFWTHTLLWFYREYKERKQRKLRPHVNVEALPEEFKGKHYQRFTATWRIAHLTFALSLMALTLTGMPLFFPDAAWAPVIMKALGGYKVAGSIHRVFATIFGIVFIWHVFYVGIKLAKNWKKFKIFGPDSLIPGLQDLTDIIAMFKWFFGLAPRPVFDRWTYWEKFDYWAPFWGVTIIGVSGLMMWFPHVTASYLPGWVFNVAMIFHGEEAILAVVFLFTVHFFNNHFRPDKFPLDTVMFTGTFPLEEFRHEHRVEYDRLVRTGELKKYLVDAPSQPMTLGAKILGFTLIVVGLSLLAMVVNGFLGH
ncbi:cytochrome c3 family protein [Noviherbaspirillum sp.]|jgi:cytochrome b subunit of formate dehydrogenase|uniref:cytochrome c3 family protein n=1 Tax=Noviherbaspirillum sp. TaxID=1926288 RepID=UPI0025F6A64E|nr:cytochrome c3 family protein [Noviherbaspirillum sp.]